nr:putative zinc finger, CCHC-type [Tanacetum cinerariifolium]
MRQLAYGTTPDAFDEYLQIAKRCSRECLDNFTKCIYILYVEEFLKRPTLEDVEKTYALHEEKHGLSGMLRSIDYLNVLNSLPLFDDVLADGAPKAPFVVNGRTYNKCYYLADGNYPAWATFVKTYSIARDEKTLKFKRVQESSRKDTKRAFGVLQGSSNVNGDIVDDNTRRYVDDALDGIIRSMEEMLNQITSLSLQTQSINGAVRPQTRYGRMTKIDFPKFSGKDVRGWIFRCEQFFLIDSIAEDQKVRLLCVHLFDKALLWHRQLLKVHEETVTWPVYRDAIMQRFGTVFDDPMSKLKNVKYDNSHKYEGQLFSLVVLAENEEMEEEFIDADDSLKDMENDEVQPQISLNALNGMGSFQTLKVVGLYDDKHELHTLVNPGSTHNFLDINMAKRLGCNIKKTCPLSIVVAGDRQLVGVAWSLEFSVEELEDVFAIPTELLPKRTHDHRIPLIEGVSPVNIRPYRHPPIQKDAIQAMVKELLESGVIKPSHSLFASPIVMIKKKDNYWRMCIDYRQLNKNTIKDKFPIPVIDELIDELHGAMIFSKLVLRTCATSNYGFEDNEEPLVICKEELKYLLDQRITISTKMKWLPKLMGFDYEVKYKKGVENAVADALSRTLLELHNGKDYRKHYTWSNGQLLRKNKMVVRKDEQLRMDLLTYFHSSSVGGHSGMKVTTHKLCLVLYWKGMRNEIKKFMKEWVTCQRNKPDLAAYPGLLQPLPIPKRIWDIISMDFIEGLPRFKGFNVIFVVVDRLTNLWPNTTYPCSILGRLSKVDVVDRILEAREKEIQMLKFHLARSQNRMKQQADKRRTERKLKVGDWVFGLIQWANGTIKDANWEPLAELSSTLTFNTGYMSGIKPLTGTNFSTWRDQVKLTLEVMDLDHALRIDHPVALTAKSIADQKRVLKLRRGTIKGTSKTHASTLILKMLTTKYDGVSGVREHIMMMGDMANKLKGMDMKITEGFLVHFIMTSLPMQFGPFKINYNTQKEKWKISELIAMCVQEEEHLKVERARGRAKVDQCVYLKMSGSNFIILVLYVDDILLASNNIDLLHDSKRFLSRNFDMKDLGEALFQYNPGLLHWKAAKKVLRYLQRTKEYKLTYTRSDNLEVIGYSDSDFVKCEDTSRLTLGYIFMLSGGPISWKSKKQVLTTTSTMMAKYVSVYNATCHAMLLRNLITGLKIINSISRQLKIYCDNSAAVSFSNSNSSTGASLYLDTKYLFVRERVDEQRISIEHIRTHEMLADPLTKGLPPKVFQGHVAKMGFVKTLHNVVVSALFHDNI